MSVLMLVMPVSFSFGGELVGYSTLTSDNQYKIINSKGAVIYQATADTVKEVALRDGYAVIQSTFNNVSLIDENGTIIVDQIYGSKYLVSKGLIAIYNPGSIGAVYDHSGKKLYSGGFVKSIGIADSRYVVTDTRTGVTELYSLDGTRLDSQRAVERANVSENFFATLNSSGSFKLENAAGKWLASESGIHDLKISNQFAAYLTSTGSLRVFTADGGMFEHAQIADFGVTDSMFWTHDLFGISVYDLKGSLVFAVSSPGAFLVSHDLIAVQTRSGAVSVYNAQTNIRFSIAMASNFSVTDRLILVQNGVAQYTVYGSDGKALLGENNSSLRSASISNDQVAFQYSTLRSARVVNVRGDVNANTVLDERQVDRLNLSLNRDELNWAAF